MNEPHILTQEEERILRSLDRPARRAALALAQTTNPKRRAKLRQTLTRLSGRKRSA